MKQGFADIVKLLIKRGGDVDCYSKASTTPLHEAAAGGKGAVIKVLLKAKADVMLTDNQGKTALDLANEFKKSAVIKLLTKGVEKAQNRNRKALKPKAKLVQSVSMDSMLRDTLGALPEEPTLARSRSSPVKRPDSVRVKHLTETERIQVFCLLFCQY